MNSTDTKTAPASSAWHDFQIPSFAGRDSRDKRGEDYETIPLVQLFTMSPRSLLKLDGPAIIPSLYRSHDARSHAAQRERGQFVALTGDVDTGDHARDTIEGAVHGFCPGSAWLVYSSPSSRPGNRKWRVVIPLAAPASFTTWHAAQTLFHDHLAAAGVEPDRALARAGQIIYAPNVPAIHEESGEPLREGGVRDGKPLYFERSHSDLEAPGLDLAVGALGLDISLCVSASLAEQDLRRKVAEEASQRRKEKVGAGQSTVDRFNAANEIADLLVQYGYEDAPSSDQDWRSPHQKSGSYATRVMTDAEGGQHWVSLSQSDREAGLGRACDSGCFGDAFDLFAHYEHGGDVDAALAALRGDEAIREFDGVSLPAVETYEGADRGPFALSPFWAGAPLPPAKPWLIYNKLPRVGVGMLVAPSQAGKTFLALELARVLAAGEPFFGTRPRETCGSLVLAGEGMSGLRNRVSVLEKLPVAIDSLPTLASPAKLVPLTEAIARDVVQAMREQHGTRLGLVVIDTLSASGLLADENNNPEAAAAINAAGLMARKLDCLVLVVHHPSKNGSSSRGAGALHANIDVEITIDYEAGKPLRVVRLTKSKESETGPLGCFTLEQENVGVDQFGDALTTCRVIVGEYTREVAARSGRASALTAEQIRACQAAIAEGDYRAAVQCGERWAGHAIGKAIGVDTSDDSTKPTVRSILSRLLLDGWLRREAGRDASRKTREFVRVGKPCEEADGG